MKKIALYLITFVLFCFCSCTLFRAGSDSLVDYIPRDSDVPGWNRTAAPVTVNAEGVEFYNSDYAKLGIDKLVSCSYSSFDDRERIMKVEVIRFNNIPDAYSFFSEIVEFSETGECPEDEYYSDTSAVLRAGEFIVYVRTEMEHIRNAADLKTFSYISRSYIGDRHSQESLPPLSNVLKRTGAQCVLYSKKGIMPVQGISRCYYSMIIEGENRYFVFLSDRGTYYDSMSLFQKITSKKFIIIKADDTQSAFSRDEKRSYVFISVHDRWIFGCWDVTGISDGKRILQGVRNAIVSYSMTVQ